MPIIPATVAIAVVRRAMGTVAIAAAIVLFRMVKVGENSGNLSEVLDYLANFYEEDVDNATKNFSSTLEPALLIIIGLTVGLVSIGIIQPIFKLIQVAGA